MPCGKGEKPSKGCDQANNNLSLNIIKENQFIVILLVLLSSIYVYDLWNASHL